MIDKIPAWVLRVALLLSLPIAGAALYLTRSYAVSNLVVLGLDADTAFVRRLSIDVLLSAHVAAFFMIALLPDRVFKFRRWQLRILAIAIWAFDGAAIYQARFGVMDSAATAQTTAVTRLADQRAAIKGLQEQAAAMRATSARQMNNKMISKGAESQAEAARLEAKAAAMAEQLAAMPQGTGTTEVRTWGWLAPYKAATESMLISFVSLIMLGLSGLAVRGLLEMSAAKRVPTPLPAREPAPAPAPVAAPVAKAAPAQAPVTPAPAPVVSYGIPGSLLKALGVGATAAAAIAPSAKAAEPAPVERAAPAAPAPAAPRLTPADAPATAPVAPERVDTSTPEQVRQVRGDLAKKAPAPRTRKAPAPAGARADTGVVGDVAGRYTRLKAAVASGKCAPSLAKVRQFAGCNQDTAAKYLAQMDKEGVIAAKASGRGWQVRSAA